jgi:diguanylate cyclase (GGDEF)-like protein
VYDRSNRRRVPISFLSLPREDSRRRARLLQSLGCFLLALAPLLSSTTASALESRRALTQARLTIWTPEAGLPQSTIDAILQSRDGYLWMGTEEGLVRFDGARFVVTDRQNAPALRAAFVSSLFESGDGALWIGTYGGGLARMRDGRIEAFRPDILGADRMRGMELTPDGSMYVATAGGGLIRIRGNDVERYTVKDGLPSDRIWALASDGGAGLWVATHGAGVVQWRDGKVVARITTREGLANDFARTLLRDPDGTLWIGTDGGGVTAWKNGAITGTITTAQGLPSDLVRILHRDRSGSLWIGTDGGLARWRDGRVETLGVAQGLPSPIIRAIVEDREGNLWVGTTGGLVRMQDTRFLSYTRKEGLLVDGVRAIVEGNDREVFVGTEGGGLCTVAGSAIRCWGKAQGLPHDTVYALARSRDGSLWIGTDGGGIVRYRDGRFVDALTARNGGLPNNRIRSMVETSDGTLWVNTTAGLAQIRNGVTTRVPELDDRQLRPLLLLPDGNLLVGTDGMGLWKVDARLARAQLVARVGQGLESDRIFSLALDAERRGVWIGTSGGGLARLDLASGQVRSLLRADGLFDDVVFQILDVGPHADLWLTSNRGLYRVSRDQVLAAMNGARADLTGAVYGAADGMPSAECNAGAPAAMRASDQRLWIATSRGIAVVDPRVSRRNDVPPPVHVEEVLLDGVPTMPGPLRVPPGTQRLEIRYTALSLRAPERVRFRYILEGYDRAWVDAGTNRVAYYTKLAPGDYTFRVVAANEDGVPSKGDASLAVTVEPRWFETWWARLAAAALLAFALWGAIRLRTQSLHDRHIRRIAAELEDTNRQLAVANVRLRTLSYIDGLTGVPNRRRFDEALEEACAAASEQREPVSLVLIDLDHFKKLNDTHGHQEGDEALRAVATLLHDGTESQGGLVARFGGEEFAWLLPGLTRDEARTEAEALRLRIRDARIPHAGSEHGIVTASLGVATIDARSTPDVDPLALVAAADAALYRAKSGGRDRVEIEPMREAG